MTSRTPSEVLRDARRRDSQQKRARVLATLEQMLARGDTITATSVARAANVSTWLVYAPGVREHVDNARSQQARRPARAIARGESSSAASLRTDLELVPRQATIGR